MCFFKRWFTASSSTPSPSICDEKSEKEKNEPPVHAENLHRSCGGWTWHSDGSNPELFESNSSKTRRPSMTNSARKEQKLETVLSSKSPTSDSDMMKELAARTKDFGQPRGSWTWCTDASNPELFTFPEPSRSRKSSAPEHMSNENKLENTRPQNDQSQNQSSTLECRRLEELTKEDEAKPQTTLPHNQPAVTSFSRPRGRSIKEDTTSKHATSNRQRHRSNTTSASDSSTPRFCIDNTCLPRNPPNSRRSTLGSCSTFVPPDPILLPARSRSRSRTPGPAVARRIDKLTIPCPSCGKEQWWCTNANNPSGTDFSLAPRLEINIEAKDRPRLRQYWIDSEKSTTALSGTKFVNLYLVPNASVHAREGVEMRVGFVTGVDGRAMPRVRLCEAKIREIVGVFGEEVEGAREGGVSRVLLADESDEFVLQVSLRCA